MNLRIGSTIKKLRLKHKITQDQLATFLDVTPQAISRWEAENGYPDIELLPAIAEYFSISTDDLLGINLSNKEKRRNEIYENMKKASELGTDRSHIPAARQYVAEFPSDERIQKNLGDVLCQAYMWNEQERDLNALKEAEKLYQTLISTTEDNELRYDTVKALAELYAIGFKDEFKAENTLSLLPDMKHCREQASSIVISRMMGENSGYVQDYIFKLTENLCNTLQEYIVDNIPNSPDMWDEKISMFEWIISVYRFVFGDNLLCIHNRVSSLYRYIATYRVAQGKYDETLDCLEKMCEHTIKANEAKSGDKYTSVFTDKMVFCGIYIPVVHNDAWYILQKLTQERYNPIREIPRFIAVKEKLKEIAK